MVVPKRLEGRGRMWKGSWRLDVGVNYIGVKADSVPIWDPWIGVGCGAGSSCSLAQLGDPHLTMMSLAPLLDTHDTQEPRGQGSKCGFWNHRALLPQLGSGPLPTQHVPAKNSPGSSSVQDILSGKPPIKMLSAA